MLPRFPKFKKLILDHSEEIESYTRIHPPYSDFNFVSLYCWNIDDNTQISLLNGNFIIQMKDYSSSKTIVSFLGTNKVDHTIEQLVNYSFKKGETELKLIPEIAVKGNYEAVKKYKIIEDEDQHDYIYELENIAKLSGSSFKKKRNLYKKFEHEYKPEIKIENLTDSGLRSRITILFENWLSKKSLNNKELEEELKNERVALNKIFLLSKLKNLFTIGMYVNNKMAGFSINTLLSNNFAYTVFEKADRSFPGVWEFLMKKKGEILYSKNFFLLNYAQDLGIEGLRKAKKSWNPVKYLKKYQILPKS